MKQEKKHWLLQKYKIRKPKCGFYINKEWEPIVEELIQELIKAGWDKRLDQAKNKFGALRFYIRNTNETLQSIINKYESKTSVNYGAADSFMGIFGMTRVENKE